MSRTLSKGIAGTDQSPHFYPFRETVWGGKLLDCLERNEQKGIVYHREGFYGDYDDFENEEELTTFILTGAKFVRGYPYTD